MNNQNQEENNNNNNNNNNQGLNFVIKLKYLKTDYQ